MANYQAVTGDKELIATLKRMGQAASGEILREGGREASNVIQAEAERRAPSRTGTLKRNIRVRGGRGKKRIRFRIGTTKKAYYAGFVEYGTKNMRPQPFLRPALDGKADEATRVFAAVVRRKLYALARR